MTDAPAGTPAAMGDGMDAVEWQTSMAGVRAIVRAPEAIRTIQVYGQRCSGTNVLIHLIEGNLPQGTFTEAYGFKHWFVPPQVLFQPSTLVVVIARDAVGWLQSVHRQPWHLDPAVSQMRFSDFIRMEWASYWYGDFWGVDEAHPIYATEMMHERDPQTGARFANPMRKRTAKLSHWAGLHRRAHNLCLVDQASVQADPEGVTRALAAMTGLPMGDTFRPVDSYKGRGVKPYQPHVYPAVSADDLAFIAANLDPKVEGSYGLTMPAAAAADRGSPVGADTTTRGSGALSVSAMVTDS
ncbi:hypothetical protein [Sphingomonas prati]|uniref:Sulfotransferase family protein n=1 Tax=Sphingomonas prati TaxID=1843237 RepID=A0A7W9EZV6_9SPHN|nr:hypothetical protein [Sphingomonas prati]MBB5727727.1 hypothetical protein [Sphingomonas prati]GGE80263.1 hypothetical protein GCM10011404_11190 [Sphingomonas prati]